jgi:hypothetical protein
VIEHTERRMTGSPRKPPGRRYGSPPMPDTGDIRWMTYGELRDAFGLPSTKSLFECAFACRTPFDL